MQKLTKTTNPNGKKTFRLYLEAKNDCVQITIFEGENAFICKILQNETNKLAKLFEIDPKLYSETLIDILFNKIDSNIDVLNDEFVVFKSNKIKYFYTKVEKTNYSDAIENVLDLIAKTNLAIQEDINQHRKQIKEIESVNQFYARKRKQFETSIESEEYLINAFLPLLNEKKKQIRDLTFRIDGEANSDDEIPYAGKIRTKPTEEPIVDKKSESGTEEDEYNTDEEVKEITTQNMAGTSKEEMDLFEEDSRLELLPERKRVDEDARLAVMHYEDEKCDKEEMEVDNQDETDIESIEQIIEASASKDATNSTEIMNSTLDLIDNI